MEFLDLEGKREKDIVFEVFNLNKLQKTLFEEMEDSKLTVKQLADKADRNRSTVQRALQDMLDKNLVMREGKTDKTVYYVYTTLPMEQIQEITINALDMWHKKVKKQLT